MTQTFLMLNTNEIEVIFLGTRELRGDFSDGQITLHDITLDPIMM